MPENDISVKCFKKQSNEYNDKFEKTQNKRKLGKNT
jgi:hypothetical protein